MADRPKVLFVCVHNSGRSRMAEAWFNELAGDRYEGISAGTQPAEHANPAVVASMAEAGVPIADRAGRPLTYELTEKAVRVIGMGCAVEEACPALRVPLEDWGLEDPKGKDVHTVARIRDEIKVRVETLIAELDAKA